MLRLWLNRFHHIKHLYNKLGTNSEMHKSVVLQSSSANCLTSVTHAFLHGLFGSRHSEASTDLLTSRSLTECDLPPSFTFSIRNGKIYIGNVATGDPERTYSRLNYLSNLAVIIYDVGFEVCRSLHPSLGSHLHTTKKKSKRYTSLFRVIFLQQWPLSWWKWDEYVWACEVSTKKMRLTNMLSPFFYSSLHASCETKWWIIPRSRPKLFIQIKTPGPLAHLENNS